jgi:hypothetical protein
VNNSVFAPGSFDLLIMGHAPKCVLICGGRDYADYGALSAWLDHFSGETPIAVVIHGGALGADSMAEQWAQERGIAVLRFDADWQKHGRAAGPIRNKQMLDEGNPDLVLAFPGGRGTANMIEQSKARGVPVIRADK